MSSLFAMRALLFAVECLGASVLLPALAWLLASTAKRASLRHLVWLTALGTLLVLPVAALVVPPRVVLEQPAPAPEKLPVTVEAAAVESDAAPAVVDVPATLTPSPAPSKKSWRPGETDIALAAFAIWLAGVLWALSRLAIGTLGLAALRRRSRPHALASGDLPQIFGRRECELRLSEGRDGPLTWGVLRPVILLPKDSLCWPRERLQAVLLHELAHVRRHDSLMQSLSLIACAFYWPNPLMWWAARELRREAEIAADDAVLVAGVKASAYAGELVKLASEFRGRRAALPGVAMAGSALEARVKSALAPNRVRTGVTSMDAFKIALLGAAATAALALARPDLVQAQDAPPPPPAPIAAPAELPPPPPPPEAADATPALPALPAVPPVPPAPPKPAHIVRVRVIHHKDGNVEEQREEHDVQVNQAEMDRAMEEVRRADEEVRRAQPEIDKAMDAAKIDARVAEAMRAVEPKIRAEIARAMAQAKPEVRRAIAEAHISEKVMKALKDAQPKIDAAMAEMRKAHRDVQVRVERDDDASGKDDYNDDESDSDDDSNK
jgi:beta-lactamase regulating signal transducer with metallopeptidase domain